MHNINSPDLHRLTLRKQQLSSLIEEFVDVVPILPDLTLISEASLDNYRSRAFPLSRQIQQQVKAALDQIARLREPLIEEAIRNRAERDKNRPVKKTVVGEAPIPTTSTLEVDETGWV